MTATQNYHDIFLRYVVCLNAADHMEDVFAMYTNITVQETRPMIVFLFTDLTSIYWLKLYSVTHLVNLYIYVSHRNTGLQKEIARVTNMYV